MPEAVAANAPEAVAATAPETQMMLRQQFENVLDVTRNVAQCCLVPATCECMSQTPIARRLCVSGNVAYSLSGFAHALASAPCAASVCSVASTGLRGFAVAVQLFGCLACHCYET